MPHADHDDPDLPDARVADRRDAIYTVLSNKHQRAVLTWFGGTGTDADSLDGQTVRLTVLADHLTTTFSMSDEQATATLHHSVLPQLEDMGLLDYDTESGVVAVDSATGMAAILRAHDAVEEAFDGADPVAPGE